jgi:hypothetical protein
MSLSSDSRSDNVASSGWRLFRRKTVLPGLRVNLSKSGPSLSVGVRGAHVTFGRRGVTRTVGIPGTGVFYTSRSGHHSGAHSAPSPEATRAGLERKLEQLHRAGLLTDDELAVKKAALNAGAAGHPH